MCPAATDTLGCCRHCLQTIDTHHVVICFDLSNNTLIRPLFEAHFCNMLSREEGSFMWSKQLFYDKYAFHSAIITSTLIFMPWKMATLVYFFYFPNAIPPWCWNWRTNGSSKLWGNNPWCGVFDACLSWKSHVLMRGVISQSCLSWRKEAHLLVTLLECTDDSL